MSCARLRLLGALIVLVTGFATAAAAKDESPRCVYSDLPLAAADVPAAAAAQMLGGTVVYSESRNGQWIGVIEIARIMDAQAR